MKRLHNSEVCSGGGFSARRHRKGIYDKPVVVVVVVVVAVVVVALVVVTVVAVLCEPPAIESVFTRIKGINHNAQVK